MGRSFRSGYLGCVVKAAIERTLECGKVIVPSLLVTLSRQKNSNGRNVWMSRSLAPSPFDLSSGGIMVAAPEGAGWAAVSPSFESPRS